MLERERERGQKHEETNRRERAHKPGIDSHKGIRQRGIFVFSHGLVFKKKMEKREIGEKR